MVARLEFAPFSLLQLRSQSLFQRVIFKKKVALKTLQKNVKMFSNFSFFTTNLNKVEVILDAKMVFELVPRISTLWSRRRRKVTLLMARWEGGGGQSDELNKLTLRSA